MEIKNNIITFKNCGRWEHTMNIDDILEIAKPFDPHSGTEDCELITRSHTTIVVSKEIANQIIEWKININKNKGVK